MIRQFVTPEEFWADHNIERYCSRENLPRKLSAAEREVRELFRSKKINTRQMQVPQMLVGDYKTPTTKATDADGSSTSVSGTRFVVEVLTDDSLSTFTLEGSEDGTNWKQVYDRITGTYISIEPTGAGIYSAPFAESYPYYRYRLTTDASVTFLCYLVDASIDLLIEYKTLELIYEDGLGDDKVDRKYEYAVQKFSTLLATISADVDIDGDGSIDSEEQSAQQVTRLHR